MRLLWKQNAFTCSLIFSSGFVLVLENMLYTPSFSRNLVSISILVLLSFSFNISDKFSNVYCKFDLVGNGTLSDGLYRLNFQNNISYTLMHVYTGIK